MGMELSIFRMSTSTLKNSLNIDVERCQLSNLDVGNIGIGKLRGFGEKQFVVLTFDSQRMEDSSRNREDGESFI